ncbi:pyruvate kinase [Halomarina pelagica]|uniref:pyruvate kinase n=1 Tax=Halomarina pelagica TaxID=2961599 RepID=UPI002115ADB8|nr:pyruvate kinase [Halomarina sp. BND7]
MSGSDAHSRKRRPADAVGSASARRNSKIVCTLGPASASRETVEGLIDAGMAVARMNASHGTLDDRRALAETVRAAAGERSVALMHDIPGPEVRTAPLDDPVGLEAGETVRFVPDASVDLPTVGISESIAAAGPGDRVLIDDGRIEATVERVEGDAVVARIDSGGDLESRKGVNVPGVDLDLPSVTEDDRRELELAAELEVDFVAASFIGSADDVYAVNEVLESHGADVPVVAKIERADAVERLDEIVDAADGVMVARGDLGVECPMEEVPLIQKRIIRRCREAGVPVITATEMLDSMVHARRPTRAEATDVANAVLDGTDAVMLSAETAVGDHPVRVVETMARIVRSVEASEEYATAREQWVPAAGETKTDALARSARFLARDVEADAIAAASESGYTARKVAKYRPERPIVVVTPDERVYRQLSLLWGTVPRLSPLSVGAADAVIEAAATEALRVGAAEPGGTVVVLSGMMKELEGTNTTNTLKVHMAADVIASGRITVTGRATGPVVRTETGDLRDAPEGAIVALPEDFAGEFTGDLSAIGGLIHERPESTNYAAIVARELGVPMVGDVTLPDDVPDGTRITVDGERGVIYRVPGQEA